MKRRILPLLLILALIAMQLPAFLAVPAQAAESENVDEEVWIDALDYASFSEDQYGTLGNTIYSDFNCMLLEIYTFVPIYEVEVVFSTNASAFEFSCFYDNGQSNVPFTVETIEAGVTYRAYGRMPGIGSSMSFGGSDYIGFAITGSPSYVTFLQVNYSIVNVHRYTTPVVGTFGYYGSVDHHFVYNDSTVSFTPYLVSDYTQTGFRVDFEFTDWRKYDYLDIVLYFQSNTVNSISAVFADQALPFTVNEIYPSSNIGSNFLISVRIDCRGLIRSSTDNPFLIVNGHTYVDQGSMISIVTASGLVLPSFDSAHTYIYLLKKSISLCASTISSSITTMQTTVVDQIQSSANDIIAALGGLMGSTGVGETVKNEANAKADEVSSGVSSMGSMSMPDSGSVGSSGSISSVISSADITSGTTVLTTVMQVPTFTKIITLALIFTMAAYVLFGKRG